MKSTRRDFLKNSAFIIAGSTLLAKTSWAAGRPTEVLGVQLYSVRDQMKSDPSGTLKKIAEIGYKNVEHANYVEGKFYGYTPNDFKKLLDSLGLKMPSGHTVMGKDHWNPTSKQFSDTWKKTIEDAATVGQKYVVSPWMDESMRKTYDDMLRYMEVFNKCGELCRKSGMKFGYHNHDFEFSQSLNGQKIFDIMMKNLDFKLVAMQLDIGNMYNGGAKALDILGKYPGKIEMIHVKDEIAGKKAGEYESTQLGKGIVPVKEALDLGRKLSGALNYVVEQESYQGIDPIECIKADFMAMKKWGF